MTNNQKNVKVVSDSRSSSVTGFQLFIFFLASTSIAVNIAFIYGLIPIQGNFYFSSSSLTPTVFVTVVSNGDDDVFLSLFLCCF